MAEKQAKQIIIPNNVMSNKRLFGCHKRNIIEGGILTLMSYAIINQIPFVDRIKWIIFFSVGGSILVLSSIGIKGYSPSELVKEFVKNLKIPKSFHFRSIKYVTKSKKKPVYTANFKTQQSPAEKMYEYGKAFVLRSLKEGRISFRENDDE